MGYDWTSIGTGSTIRITEFNEFKTNIDSLYSSLELDPPSWTYLPVVAKDVGVEDILLEVRDKADTADDSNTCRNDNVSYDITVDTGDNATIHADYNLSVDDNDDTGVDSSYDSNVDNDDNGTVNAGNYGTYQSTDNDTVNSSYLTEFV